MKDADHARDYAIRPGRSRFEKMARSYPDQIAVTSPAGVLPDESSTRARTASPIAYRGSVAMRPSPLVWARGEEIGEL